MAVITDYNSLQAAVIQIAEDDSAEFANYIPIAIDLAEVRLSRDIDTLGLMNVATVTVANNSNVVTKPSGYKNGQDLTYTNASTGQVTVMKKRTYSYVLDYWPIQTSVGNPQYYADVDVNTFIIAPTANTSIAMTLRYEGRPTPLTTINTTNYFTVFCSDALYFATMSEMMKFARNAQGVQIYEQEYAIAVGSLLNEARRQRRDNSGKPENAALNTLKGDV